MIATFDQGARGVRRWSLAGLVLSVVLGAVALTGAVRGQDNAPKQDAKEKEGAAAQGEPARTAAAQAESAAPAAAEAKAVPFTDEDAEKLWREKYADRIISVNGREANRQQVDAEYLEEVARRSGRMPPQQVAKLWNDVYADKLIFVNGQLANRDKVFEEFSDELKRVLGPGLVAFRARDSITIDANGKASPAPDRTRPGTSAPAPAGPGRGGAAADPRPEVGESAEDRAMAALLARRLPELNFDGVALSDVVDFLRDVSNANLFVEWGALEAAGLDRNTPVTVRVKDVAFSHALEMVLSSAGKGSVALDYGLKGGVIRISTGEDLDKYTETRAYDVRDLVPAEIEMKELAALLKEAVNPDSWRENGGSVGSVHTTKHKLIITTTDSTHRGVRGILAMLRDEPRQARTEEAATAAQGPAGLRR